MNPVNQIQSPRDNPGHPARALPLAAVSDITSVITPRESLRRVLTSIALPLAALGLGQLVPIAQADVLPVTSGLQCWYDASVGVTTSGSTVTGWADQSGNGKNATPGVGTPLFGTSQINGRPAVFFRGGDNYLNINSNIVPKQEYIVFKSGNYNRDPGNANKWGGDWGGPFGQQNNDGWMLEGNTKQMWDGNSPDLVTVNGTDATKVNNRWQFPNVNQYMVLKVNPRNSNSAFGRIGRPNINWGNGYIDVAEIIVYNRVLTPSEENLLGAFLAGKYQIATAYPPLPLMVSVSSPANNQAYTTNASVTASATVPEGAGTGPYSVQFYKKVGAGAFLAEGSPVTGAGPTLSLSLGALGDDSYQIYATVTDSVSATATSATNTFTVSPPTSTTTVLSASGATTYGQTATFTATVSPAPTGGTVQFYADGNPLGSPVAVNTSTGAASKSTALLTAVTHSITAQYSGYQIYVASDATAISQTVSQALLTATADNKVRNPGYSNPTLSYKITGYKNGENASSAGISGAAVLSCLANPSSAVGPYDITATVGSLTAVNYSFTAVNGILNVMVGAPPVANGMVCWFDASNGVTANGSGAMSQWNDLSGNGHHATDAGGTKTLAENQLNGKSVAQFRGGYLNCAGTFFAKEQYVVVRSLYSNGWGTYGGFLGRASGRGSNVMMAPDQPTFWNDRFPDAVTKNGTAVAYSASPLNGNYCFNIAPINSFMLLKIKVNDENTSAAAYRIANSDGNTLQFDIAEIVAYDTALSSTDEAKVGRYLADKYAITATYTPQAPTTLMATGLVNSIALSWPTVNGTSYDVYRGTATGVYDPTPIATGVTSSPWTDSTVTAGTQYFYVVKAANSNDPSPEANATTTTAAKADQTITFGALVSKTYLDPSYALSATASSSLPVSYEIVESPDPLVVSISGNIVTILKAGTVTIRATQSGSALFNAATPVDQTLTVAKANQTLTFTLGSSLGRGSDAAPFADTATTTNPSGNAVTYSSSDESVATVNASSGTVTIVGVGTTLIVANQAGDTDYYNDATPVSQQLRVISAGLLPVVNGLACWFDASNGVTADGNGAISQWNDLSGNEHHATGAGGTKTLAANQLNGKSAAQFRGGYLNCAGTFYAKEQYIVVRSPNPVAWGYGAFLGRASGRFSNVMMAGDNGYFWSGDSVPLAVSKNGTVVQPTAYNNHAFDVAPINEYMILKITVNNLNQTNGAYRIANSDGNTLQCDIAEIIAYDSVLSPADEAAMTTYLTNKYFATVSPYASWASTKYPGADLTDSAADLDDDGMSNFAEYAFGLNPTTGASLNAISPLVGLNFSYTRTSNTSLTYTVWHSMNLQDWFSTLATQGTPTSYGGEIESVPVTLDSSLLAEPKLFLRVTAE